jgi:DNA-directed RNA polymerase subunit alpha
VLIAQRPVLSEEVVADNRSRFVIEPLEPGFGYTLGNSLRRTLLSSIPGAAVTSMRIDGVLHEFQTIPGCKEDVTEIILNIKGLVVSSEHDEPVVMYLRKQGPGRSPLPTSRPRPVSRCTTPTCTSPRSTPRVGSRWS